MVRQLLKNNSNKNLNKKTSVLYEFDHFNIFIESRIFSAIGKYVMKALASDI